MKLQEKKASSAHSKKDAIDVFSYVDSIGNNLAFVSFTEIKFKTNKPTKRETIFFSKYNTFIYKEKQYQLKNLDFLLENLSIIELYELEFCFDKELNYDEFLHLFINIKTLEIKKTITSIYFI